MKRRNNILNILQIAARTLSILLITGWISGVPAIVLAADMDPVGETVIETDADGAFDEADIYVVGANTVIDRIGLNGYDGVTADSMELYTAFEADLNLEKQGGRYFKGHEILNFQDTGIKVYDKENYEKLTGNDPDNAVTTAKPSDFNSTMVFALKEIPVEMSANYMLFVDPADWDGDDVYYLERVAGTALYAWEYEKQQDDGTYKRIKSVPISGEDFTLNDDNDTMYVNLGLGHIDTQEKSFDDLPNLDSHTAPRIYSYLSEEENSDLKKDKYQHVPTLSGLVRLDGSDFEDPSNNPIAIAAMCYDATTTAEDDLYKIPSTENTGGYIYHEYSWDNNEGFVATEGISYDWYYYGRDDSGNDVNYTKYWSDEPYYASDMGSFSLRPYLYRFTDTDDEHTLTLYNVSPYSLFVRRIQEELYLDDNWKAANHGMTNLPIGTWKIPATYTDPVSKKTYNVRIAKGGNIVPQYASKLIIEDGVGFPDDCSYLFSSTASVNLRCLSEIVIQGDAKSVGSNITNMSYMFLGKMGGQGSDATTYASLDFAALDTSNVTDMSFMFADVTMTNRTNIDVTTLDTSNVRNFAGMFRSYHVPGGWDPRATALDLSHFNTANAENMSEMFEGSTVSALDLSGFDFSKVTDMSRMCTFTEDLESITFPSDMDSSKVTDMSFMFAGDYNLTKINNITAMDTGSVTDMSGMFGAHKCNQKKFETGYMYQEPDVYSGSYLYDKREYELYGFAVFNPAWVTAELFDVNDGPALTSLDLSGFDTRKVKYANGMFYMPALTEIKWGTNTTFEALSDAGGMFTLDSIKKLDLTGRKFRNIKFAHSEWFPTEMFNLKKARELVLGEDSINLSDLSSKGQLMINAPKLYSLDFRAVGMGANALMGKNYLYPGSPGSLQGVTRLHEIYLPAGMSGLTSPAELPGTFYDDENPYTEITGGYENDLYLVNPEAVYTPPTLTVSYLYADGKQAAAPFIAAIEEDTKYSVIPPVIPGFSPDKEIVSGTMGDEDVNVTVTYIADPAEKYAVTVINGSGGGNYEAGVTVTIRAKEPAAGKEFKEWTSQDGVVFKDRGSASTTFVMPAKNVTVEAKYKDIIYTVKADDDGHGTATASPGSGTMGTEVTLKASPNSGYEFKEWKLVKGDVSFDKSKASTAFKIKNSNVEVKAIFAQKLPVKTSIRNATIKLSDTSLKYNGKEQKPAVKSVKLNGKTLSSKTDYDIKWSNSKSKKPGTYTVTITGKGNYKDSKTETYKIVQGDNPLSVTAVKEKYTVKYSDLKKKDQTIKKAKIFSFKNEGAGKITYSVSSAKKDKNSFKKYFSINSNGKLTIKKGLEKGTYTVKINVKAKGDKNYKEGTKTVKFAVNVKK